MKKILSAFICCFVLVSFKGVCNAPYFLDVLVYGSPANANECNSTGFSVNGMVVEYCGCLAAPAIHIAIFDSANCRFLNNCNNNFGQANVFSDPDGDCINDPNTTYTCRPRPENYFIYRSNDAAGVQAMAGFLDSIPAGNFILAYSFFPSTYSTMDPSFINVFQGLGSVMISSLADELPFIFFSKKGDAASVAETVGSAPNSILSLQAIFQCSPTAVNEMLFEMQGAVFPNPVSDKMHLEIPGQIELPLLLSFYDSVGKLVFEQKISNKQETVSTKNFPSGFYFVKVTGDNYQTAARLAVIHK